MSFFFQTVLNVLFLRLDQQVKMIFKEIAEFSMLFAIRVDQFFGIMANANTFVEVFVG